MAVRNLPPKVIEARSDERQVFVLLNALRAELARLQVQGGGAVFSTRFTTNAFGGHLGTEEVQDQIELPSALETFDVLFGGQVKSAGGTGLVLLRLGGGDRTADGTIIATLSQSSPTFTRLTDSEAITNAALATRLKVSIISAGPGQLTQFKDGFLVIQ